MQASPSLKGDVSYTFHTGIGCAFSDGSDSLRMEPVSATASSPNKKSPIGFE